MFLRVTSIKTGSSAANEVFDADKVKVTSFLVCSLAGNRLAAAGTSEDVTSRAYKATKTNFLGEMRLTPEALVARLMAADLGWRCIADN